MGDPLQSYENTNVTNPQYYTDYLSGLATNGQNAVNGMQFTPTDPNTTKGIQGINNNVGNYQPTLNTATGVLGTGTNLIGNAQGTAGNVQGSLNNATGILGTAYGSQSPLAAASGYLQQGTQDPSKLAAQYMSPYMDRVVKSIGDLGDQNIMTNLMPQANATNVSSGNFNSSRGMQALGNTYAGAKLGILGQQNSALQSGWKDALTAAGQQNQTVVQAGNTAANAASAGQQNLTGMANAGTNIANAGTGLVNAQNSLASTAGNLATVGGTLAQQTQDMGLKDNKALIEAGTLQRGINKEQQSFPLDNISKLSDMLRGYNPGQKTEKTITPSGLSILAGIGSGGMGLITPNAKGQTPLDVLKKNWKDLTGGSSGDSSAPSTTPKGGLPDGATTDADGNITLANGDKLTSNGDGSYTDHNGNRVSKSGAAMPEDSNGDNSTGDNQSFVGMDGQTYSTEEEMIAANNQYALDHANDNTPNEP